MPSLSPNKTFRGLTAKLFSPVDNSPLVLFRILFGFLLFYHCVSFMTSGKLYDNFIAPPFTFTYIGFEFLQPLPGKGMYFYFGLMALLGLLIMLGAWYRAAMTGFTVLWTLVYLMQKSNYNNHYYLVLLLCYLMCFMPAHSFCSVDVKRNAVRKEMTSPAWVRYVFIFQAAVIYFYAALSKFTPDWFSGKFIAIQFAPLQTRHLTGAVYANQYFQLLVCYGGLVFDLFIVPLLLWKRTRTWAFAGFCLFHLFNSYSFRIGIFPYLSISMALFFLDAGKIGQLFFKRTVSPAAVDNNPIRKTAGRQWLLYGLAIYIFLQVCLPMRSWFYPGNVFWTEEGYRMSWKMMLRSKTGTIHFKVTDPASGKTWIINPADKFSRSHAGWIAICPDIVWQYAQHLKKEFNSNGYPNVAVYAIDSVSLNKNPLRLLIDSNANLAALPWQPFSHSEWILR